MTTMERRFFAGDTLAQAVMAAARHFGLDPGEVAYRQVEKRHGFVKTRRKVLVEVDPAAPRREKAPGPVAAPAAVASAGAGAGVGVLAPREAPREWVGRVGEAVVAEASAAVPPPPAPVAATEVSAVARVAAVAEAVRRICAVADLRLEPEIRLGGEALLVALRGEDEEVLAEDDGEVVGAFEYLLPRAARGLVGELVAVRVGSGEERETGEEDLRALALRAAEEVRREGRPKTLERMTPAERRVVHMALAEVPGVATESRGEGFYKRVVVRPA
jgi:predicted RNA-binding protein Jag